jgi:hypothetical protein
MHSIALDSQTYSYMINAWVPDGPEESDPLRAEKLALVHTYFYYPQTFNIPPSVMEECRQIRDAAFRITHEEFLLVAELVPYNQSRINRLTKYYEQFHSGERNRMDCQIVAEAESCDCDILLTFDSVLRKRLSGKTETIQLLAPSEFWAVLSIPHGAKPHLIPHATNPLATKTWWKW